MFLLDQIQEAACEGFKQARKKTTSKRSLWEKIRTLFISYLIDSWDDLWQALINGYQMHKLMPNQYLSQLDEKRAVAKICNH